MENALDVIAELGVAPLSLLGTLFFALLRWFALAWIAALALYFVVRRLGWLDLDQRSTRWSRVGFFLLLALLSGPALTAFGVGRALREATCDQVQQQLVRTGAAKAVGQLALSPLVVLSRVTTDPSAIDVALMRSQLAGMKPDTDVSFLLPRQRRPLIDLLGGRLTETALMLVEVDDDASAVERYLVRRLVRSKLQGVDRRVGLYREVLAALDPGADGRLSWAEAGGQAGGALVGMILMPMVRSAFTPYLTGFALVAALPPLLWLVGVRLAGRRRRAPPEAKPRAPAADTYVADDDEHAQ